MKTNLSAGMENRYFRVTRPFEVLALVGHSNSNTHIGSSMLLGNVYRRVALERGDEVHALVGGDFVVRARGGAPAVFEARFQLSEKHPFEKNYGGEPVDRWPLENLEPLPPALRREVEAYRPVLNLPRMAPGAFVGHSLDSILPEERPVGRLFATREKAARSWLAAAKRRGVVTVIGGGWWAIEGLGRVQGLAKLARRLEGNGVLVERPRGAWLVKAEGGAR